MVKQLAEEFYPCEHCGVIKLESELEEVGGFLVCTFPCADEVASNIYSDWEGGDVDCELEDLKKMNVL
jgi:hypothetical protein